MIHTLMEVDSHPLVVSPTKIRGPTGLSFGTLRHHCQKNKMLKRERSPEESDADADRPLVGVSYALCLGWLTHRLFMLN